MAPAALRGDVWLADMNPVLGHEQAGRRPVLVLSIDAFNRSHAELVTVLPITGTPRPRNPFRVALHPPEGGLTKPSYVIGEQCRTISSRRLGKRLGAVSVTTLAEVSAIVAGLLGV